MDGKGLARDPEKVVLKAQVELETRTGSSLNRRSRDGQVFTKVRPSG